MINTKLGSNTTLSAIRRQTGAGSLCAFMKMYLPHRVPLPWSRMHKEMSTDFDQIGSGEPLHLVLAAPDGYGKTTMTTFGLVLWALAYKRCRCIAIGSHTRTAAGELLRSVDHELSTNKMLCTDFSHLADLQRGSGSSGSRASPPRDIYVRGVARLTTFGPTSSLGEITFEGSPPDLIILDGFEASPEESEGPDGRDGKSVKLERHIHREILSRYTGASVIVLGPLTHANSLIDRILDPFQSMRWTKRFYQAVDSYPAKFDLWFSWAELWHKDPAQAKHYLDEHREQLLDGVEVLWPEHESFEQMMSLRALHGWEWFDRNRQGAPPGGCWRICDPFKITLYPGGDGTEKQFIVDHAGYRREWSQQTGGEGRTVMLTRGLAMLAREDDLPSQVRPVPISQNVEDGGTAF
ncbi:hypothetical protein COB72_00330 [bacterium]|nr:MAG: hypothetical protein COB72_00330 [bacterium]